MVLERSVRQRLMVSPPWPAPMMTLVVRVRLDSSKRSEAEGQATSTVTLVGFVITS